MGLFRKKHDVSDIYGVRRQNDSPFTRRGEVEAPESGRRHSDYYHKYFRGYTEIRRLNEKGRVVIERYYTRPWIVCALSNGRYWLLRLLYTLLTAASAVLFITALTRDIPANYSWIAAIPGYASVILLVLLAASTAAYIFADRKMTLWGHASSTGKLKRFALAASAGQLLTAAALLAVLAMTKTCVTQTLLCAGASALGGVCSGAMYWIERRVPYTEIPNETGLPEGEAHEIW